MELTIFGCRDKELFLYKVLWYVRETPPVVSLHYFVAARVFTQPKIGHKPEVTLNLY